MRIFVTGIRGIPDIPGGIEKHCQELYPRIVSKGHDVCLCTRSAYVRVNNNKYKGVVLKRLYSPRIKSFEAIIHTFISLLNAHFYAPHIVHIHAIGPSLLTPLAKIMGFKVVITNHGPDYNRLKWGWIAKAILRLGEKVGGIYADEVITISSLIRNIVHKRCHRNPVLIYNGISIAPKTKHYDYITSLGTEPQKYILAVARFVPEKGLHDLIHTFRDFNEDYHLVIAGDVDHETHYSRNLRQIAAKDERIILPGYLTGEYLKQVYSHAKLFVLPSYHEGLPIALLEALSFGLPVLISDIPANREVGLPPDRYFRCGDISDLNAKLGSYINAGWTEEESQWIRGKIKEHYDWDRIATQTIEVYERVLN